MVEYDGRRQDLRRTVVLACSVEYSKEGLFTVDETFFNICVLDSWEPLDGKFVFDESDLGEAGRGGDKDARWERKV